MKTFSMKESKKDHMGHKTTITVTTENPEVIKSLMNTASEDGEKTTASNRKAKSSKSNTSNKSKAPKKGKVKIQALPAPTTNTKPGKKKTAAKKTSVKSKTNTNFVPKDETVIYSKGKWVITKKPIGGLYTYSLYEKEFCRSQLIFMPDDDKKAFKEFKDRIKEEFF